MDDKEKQDILKRIKNLEDGIKIVNDNFTKVKNDISNLKRDIINIAIKLNPNLKDEIKKHFNVDIDNKIKKWTKTKGN